MRFRSMALALVIAGTALTRGASVSAQQVTALPPAAFVQAKKVTRGVFEGLTLQRSFRLTPAGLTQVLTRPWLTISLRNRLVASHQAGTLKGVVLGKVHRVGSVTLSTVWLFYDGSLIEMEVPESYGDDDGGSGGGEGDDPDVDFKACPWFICMIEGQQCHCDGSVILVPTGDECPDPDPNCCSENLCDETETDFELDSPADMSTLFG